MSKTRYKRGPQGAPSAHRGGLSKGVSSPIYLLGEKPGATNEEKLADRSLSKLLRRINSINS